MARHQTIVGLAIAALLLGSACATTEEANKPVTYSLTAKQNYEKGLKELKGENYEEATRFFSFVRQKFPFSKYAVLAELALADAHFERANYQEAIDAFRTFMRLHPTHEKVEDGYAAFKIAECYVKEMSEDWFLVPPAAEKDQAPVRDAYRELNDFMDKYPDSSYVKQAHDDRRAVMQRLVEHEVYVARFYLTRGQPRAAINRLDTAIRLYPDSGREPELLLTLGQTQLEMGKIEDARTTFARVVSDFGTVGEARSAQLYLDFIRKRYGGLAQEQHD